MKVLFTKTKGFVKKTWWIAFLVAIFPIMATFPPNFMNNNKVKGRVIELKMEKTYLHVHRAGGGYSDALRIILDDSSEYVIFSNSGIKKIKSQDVNGKLVEMIYTRTRKGLRLVAGLKVEEKVIIGDNYWLLAFAFLCVIWSLSGAAFDFISFWNSVPSKIAKSKNKSIIVRKVEHEKPITSHCYTKCPACGSAVTMNDKECPDCGLGLC